LGIGILLLPSRFFTANLVWLVGSVLYISTGQHDDDDDDNKRKEVCFLEAGKLYDEVILNNDLGCFVADELVIPPLLLMMMMKEMKKTK